MAVQSGTDFTRVGTDLYGSRSGRYIFDYGGYRQFCIALYVNRFDYGGYGKFCISVGFV